jgi:hypothetical protein
VGLRAGEAWGAVHVIVDISGARRGFAGASTVLQQPAVEPRLRWFLMRQRHPCRNHRTLDMAGQLKGVRDPVP